MFSFVVVHFMFNGQVESLYLNLLSLAAGCFEVLRKMSVTLNLRYFRSGKYKLCT
jgi:hypothetical protein